ncbi:hypothetical protein [Cryobacterium fucosi]|uniref:Peptidase S1 domain-containing protein n=1 Tax=Cryobacterium fucosi TaxID=1259157 RepID=A0A4R9B5I1_9MICO|nr:hypothetical protein [Cryobacterium fucosi]TFD75940.1 hypothetical protein E3T48_10960 [Cryobacterium fucosi]
MSKAEDFEEPSGNEAAESEETASSQEFEAPPDDSAGGGQASFVPDSSALSGGYPTQLLDAHGELAAVLKAQARTSGAQTVALDAATDGLSNIEGVAIGLGEPGDGMPGEPTLNVFVAKSMSSSTARQAVVDGLGIQSASDVPMTIRKSGQFETQQFNFRARPAPGGISVGHVKVTAGTLGCLALGRSAPRNSRLLVLSNNHVLANSNSSVYGDSIIQPGRYDGGVSPKDRIAILERFVPIKFGGATNYVDCATGWAWPALVRREELYRTGAGFGFFRIGSTPQYPALGNTVGKSGRTTELTQGKVVATNWAGYINYGSAGQAYFAGQFVVQGNSGTNFSAGGDSGSVIWKWQSGLPPVGLLFAGGGGYTIASPMPWVTYFLDINLYT